MGLTRIEFLKLIVAPNSEQKFDLRIIKTDRKLAAKQEFAPTELEQLEAFIQEWNGKGNVYFGILPRPAPNFARVLWNDLDFKMYKGGEKEARERLAAYKPAPHITVFTGGGLHVYWLLDTPIPTTHITAKLKAIAAEIGGDPASTDPSRIFRVPDTFNVKKDYPVPPLCFIESVDPALELISYAPADFSPSAEPEEEPNAEPKPATKRSNAAYATAVAIAKTYAPAVEGELGDNHTFRLCAHLTRNLGLSSAETFAILWEHWNPRCRPPWDKAGLQEKIVNSRGYGTDEIGSDDPGKAFLEVADEDALTPDEKVYRELDEKFRIVNDHGQCIIYGHYEDHQGPYWHGYIPEEFIKLSRFTWGHGKTYENKKVVPRALHWLEDTARPTRLAYDFCTFDPQNTHRADMFNTFIPLPAGEKGDWSLLEELMFDILAGKDRAVFDYVMNWCALAVQRPWEKPGTTLVFRGIQGTGKTYFGEMFRCLFGRYGMTLDSPDQLTGHFNAHLRENIGLFVDEAFWSRDFKQEGVMKSLVTNDFKVYEAKYRAAIFDRSFSHIIMASNNEHVARIVGPDERRFVVMNVDTKKPAEWYGPLFANREKILLAWRYALLHYDISKFIVTQRPTTDGYAEQMNLSRDPLTSWLVEFVSNDYEDELMNPIKPGVFRAADIRETIIGYMRKLGERVYERGAPDYIAKHLVKLLPGLMKRRVYNKEKKIQEHCYIFPPLVDAKKALGIKDDPLLIENIEDLI